MHVILGPSNARVATYPSDRVSWWPLGAIVYAPGPAGNLAQLQELMGQRATKIQWLFIRRRH
jgi:hypothetical protein